MESSACIVADGFVIEITIKTKILLKEMTYNTLKGRWFTVIEVKGTQTEAKIFTNNPQETAIEQIEELCNQEFMKDLKVRIMPDYHAGKGCVIGTTIKIEDKVVPNLVGVDVGCGILTVHLKEKQIDFAKLDKVIREFVPSGQNIHENVRDVDTVNIVNFKAKSLLSIDRTNKSLGTLGSGNHFIEVSKDEEDHLYLTIHTGSRYVGAKIAEHYQKVAYRELKKVDSEAVIEKLKAEGRHNEIADTLKKLKSEIPNVKKDLAYLEGSYFDDYIHDMKLAQQYARGNRQEIANIILKHMKLSVADIFDTIHNYIDTDSMILRKGAVSASKGERLIIPINMRDGSILAVGKGNPDWNYSAPHGAGRVLSRTKAKAQLELDTFRETMKDVWSTSVGEDTLDEAPMAYKSMEEIMSQIGDTVDVLKIIKPVYNFKAADEPKFWEKKRKQKK